MKRAVWLATLMWCWMGATSVQANDHDVAESVVFFLSDRSRMVTGQRLLVNAGEHFDT